MSSGGDEVEYSATSPVVRAPDLDRTARQRLRREYGYLRAYFRERAAKYAPVQRRLNQGRFGVAYDVYLAKSAQYAIALAVLGALVGVLLSLYLVRIGFFEGIRAPAQFRGSIAEYLRRNDLLYGGLAVTLVGAVAFGAVGWLVRWYYPSTRVSTRRQTIDVNLPHAIVYMYALSYGGMDLTATIRRLADAEDTYGEVAREFDQIVRDIDIFGTDLITALENARNLTPSDNVEQFLDDLLSVLDAGGDVTLFLEREAENYLEEARDEQEDFLETLAILSELFITAFVAAPLFVIVILVVISLLGGQTLSQAALLIYAVIPLGMAGFFVLIDTLSEPFSQVGARIEEDRPAIDADAPTPETMAADARLTVYRRQRRREAIVGFLRDPLARFRTQPLASLVVTAPLAVLAVGAAVVSGQVDPSLAGMLAEPIRTTVGLVVLPFLVVTVPLSYYYERLAAREGGLVRRFPDTLNVLSSANRMGIGLVEALDLVSRSSTGLVAEELRKVRNDIVWNSDVRAAILEFGRRLDVPQVSRTIRLIADGVGSTGDLSRVLAIAAEDARNRYRLDRARVRELSSYTAIVVIGFLVYLLVVLVLDSSYLQPIADLRTGGEIEPGAPGTPARFGNVPIESYRLLFFHSALVQGVGSGLLAGKIAENSAAKGLKYAIGLVVLSVGAFALV